MPSQVLPRASLKSLRTTLPPILTIPATSTGNNVPKSLHKTRRVWKTNTHRMDQPLMVLESVHKDRFGRSVMKGVKMRIKDLRSFDKAGGVEGTLLTQSPNNFTPFGLQLRADLFNRLHQVRNPNTPQPPAFSLGMGRP